MKVFFRKYLVAAGLVPWMLQGCSDMPGAGTGGGALEIVADIAGAVTVDTRTVEDEFGSYDSDYDFSEGDMIGFYSLREDIGDETGVAAMPLFKDDAFVMDFNGYTVYGFSDKADLVEKPDTGGEDPDGGDGGSGSGTEGSGEDQSGSGQPGNIE